MVLKRGFHSVIFLVLFLALAIKNTEGNRKTLQRFIKTRHGLDDNMAELAWLRCRRVDFSKSSLLTKKLLFDCLREKSLLFRLLSWPSTPRRFLAATASQSVSRTRHHRRRVKPRAARPVPEAPAPAPAVSPSEAPRGLTPVSSPASLSPPPPEDVYLPIGMFEFAPPPPHRQRSHPPPPPPPHPQPRPPQPKNGYEARRIALIGTAAGMFVVLASVLLCCLTGGRRGRDDGHRDEKPLLALSSSNYSGGSSRNSPARLGSSSNNEAKGRIGHLSTNSWNREQSEEAMAESGIPQLKPPPGKAAPPPPEAAPPPPLPPKPAPPPPPPKAVRPPPAPPKTLPGKSQSNAPKPQRKAQPSLDEDAESGSQKAKLKPFFWDKTVLTNTDQSMVWNEIRSGSFQFNEEMIETLFGYNNADKDNSRRKKDPSSSEPAQYIQIIETKKAQNLAILLRALNVTTEEVVDALREGNELPVDLIETLLKVAPTTEEELKLRLFSGDPGQLGPAERFLKVLVDIPNAYKRLESLLFMCSFQEEFSSVKESLATLEVACNKLRSSRLFLKLLEAVLKTGNRMNDGTYRGGAQAFRLDTLLKLADVKGTDGKTTLLHFVVNEIIRSEGARAVRDDHDHGQSCSSAGLEVVSGLSGELEDVRRAAAVDPDALSATLSGLADSLLRTRRFLGDVAEDDGAFLGAVSGFAGRAEADVAGLLEQEKRTMALVKSTTDYFHGNAAGKDEGLRLFVIVRDFLIMVDKVCREASKPPPPRSSRNDAPPAVRTSSSESLHSLSDARQRLFPAIAGRRIEDSSSSSDEDT